MPKKNKKDININMTPEVNLPIIKEIKELHDLNALGCHYIISANHKNTTRIITRSMRWLTVQRDEKCLSKEQEKARKKIDQLIIKSDKSIQKNLNLHILLDRDPRVSPGDGEMFDDTYIKKLISIGADVRYLERENRMKLVLQENELYLSFSQEQSKVVYVGYQYIGVSKDDSLCRYVEDEFDRLFEQAQKLAVKNDEIVLAKTPLWERIKSAFSFSPREKAIMIIGVLISAICLIIPYIIAV